MAPEMSAADIAQLVADGYCSGEDSGDDAFDAESTARTSTNGDSDDDDSNDDTSNQDLDACVGSNRHVLNSNALMAKLGSNPTTEEIANLAATRAQEYIVECFDDDSSTLDKEKFDAIPKYFKSDLLIGQFLGKGSFSDAFEVILTVKKKFEPKLATLKADVDASKSCDDNQDIDAMIAAAAGQFGGGKSSSGIADTSNSTPVGQSVDTGRRRRAPRRSSSSHLSSSICMGTMSKNSPSGTTTRVTLAMKCLRPQIRVNPEQFLVGVEDLIHETAILASLDHPNIIKIHGRSGGSVSDSFRLSDGYFILLDKLSDTLEDRIKTWKKGPSLASKTKGPPVSRLQIMTSLADALLFLHQNHICFRDLKPANVGFNESGVLKLFDFGFAVTIPEDAPQSLLEKCGTLRYMAPEVGLGIGYGLEADVFSFGIMLWEISALKKPFSKVKSAQEFEKLVFEKNTRPKISKRWPKSLQDLILKCWSTDPQERYGTSVVKSLLTALVQDQLKKNRGSGNSLAKSLRSSITRRVTWD